MNTYFEQIENNGYCIVPSEYSPEIVEKLLQQCKSTYEMTKDKVSDLVPYLNQNQPTLYNLQNKEFLFLETLFASKKGEAILTRFLNDKWYKQIPPTEPNYILRSFGARSSNAALPLHIDSFIPYSGNDVIVMQYAIVLEDQYQDNGCTIVVPGSHKSGQYANQDALKDAIPIEPKAGDVVIWDSRLWHGTTTNKTNNTRWAVIATFCRWWIKQHFNITDNMPQGNYERLTDKQKSILGFCSVPWNTEYEGIDLKRGYDTLEKDVTKYKL